ncbi:hypothetical protein [Peptostreptococcus stomatis]|uniref:hypothetical protein n=1 Tax=Peptostreptococcus stomatis TaxID=341694 RepID=UPI000306358A|nr:hypothetical protein [Peptostreptococcus stomatis]
MKKIIKILLGLTVLFALLMLTVTYFLKPSDRLKNDDRLWNVSDNVDIDSYNREVLGNISLDKGKLVSEIKIDDYNFKKLLKYALAHNGNAEMQEASYSLKGDRILIKYPVKLWLWNSQVDIEASLSNTSNELVFKVEEAKLGKVNLSKNMISRVLAKLKETGYGNIRIEDKKIYVQVNAPNISIRKASIANDVMRLQVLVKYKGRINIQREIIETLVQ